MIINYDLFLCTEKTIAEFEFNYCQLFEDIPVNASVIRFLAGEDNKTERDLLITSPYHTRMFMGIDCDISEKKKKGQPFKFTKKPLIQIIDAFQPAQFFVSHVVLKGKYRAFVPTANAFIGTDVLSRHNKIYVYGLPQKQYLPIIESDICLKDSEYFCIEDTRHKGCNVIMIAPHTKDGLLQCMQKLEDIDLDEDASLSVCSRRYKNGIKRNTVIMKVKRNGISWNYAALLTKSEINWLKESGNFFPKEYLQIHYDLFKDSEERLKLKQKELQKKIDDSMDEIEEYLHLMIQTKTANICQSFPIQFPEEMSDYEKYLNGNPSSGNAPFYLTTSIFQDDCYFASGSDMIDDNGGWLLDFHHLPLELLPYIAVVLKKKYPEEFFTVYSK